MQVWLLLTTVVAGAFLHQGTSVINAEPTESRLAGFVEHLIPLNGATLCCLRRRGVGPTLLLIPGTFSDCRRFEKVVPHLDAAFDLMVLENRGLGRSWPPPENGSIEQCARDALLIAKKQKVSSFYVGGHSLGGMISLELGRVAPEKLRGIISIEGWTSWHVARDAFQHDMKSTLNKTQLAEQAKYRKQVLQKWNDAQVQAFVRVWKRWDGYGLLKETKLPVLEMYGDRGKPKPLFKTLRIPCRKNIEFMWFEKASHNLPYEQPSGVATAINRFIHRIEATQCNDHAPNAPTASPAFHPVDCPFRPQW